MYRIPKITLLGLILLAIPGTVFAAQSLTTTYQNNELPMPTDFCPVGQGWPGFDPAWVDPGTITGGGQTFYALVDPGENCDCPVGFQMSTIDFFMTLPEEATYPTDLQVSVGLREAVPDPNGVFSWLPGGVGCESPVRQFTIPFPKQFLGFGMAVDCECFEIGSPAFLYFTIHSDLATPGGLLTAGGGAPATGRFLTQTNGQWVDLVDAGILTQGPLVVSGFAQCCEPPVPATQESWGSIKALYR